MPAHHYNCILPVLRSRGESEGGRDEGRIQVPQFDSKIPRPAEGSFFNPGLESMPVQNWDTIAVYSPVVYIGIKFEFIRFWYATCFQLNIFFSAELISAMLFS